MVALLREGLKGHARPEGGPATGTRTGPGLTGEGGGDSVGVDGVGGVAARAGFAEVRRCLGSRDRRAPRVEAEVKELAAANTAAATTSWRATSS